MSKMDVSEAQKMEQNPGDSDATEPRKSDPADPQLDFFFKSKSCDP